MKITKAIITAMKEEAELIIEKFSLKKKEISKLNSTIQVFTKDRFWDEWEEEIVLVLAPIWKIWASIWTMYLFENYDIFKLINIWIAWSLWANNFNVGDVFLPNTFIQHDIYLPFDWEHLDFSKKAIFLDYAIGHDYNLEKFNLFLNWICLTWDQFIDDIDKQKFLKESYSWDIVDMESFAILSVAKAYNKLDSVVVIKAISDWADNKSKDVHMTNLDFAMRNALIVLDIVL